MLTLTSVPLPTWKNMTDALINSSISDNDLSDPWRSFGDTAFWFSRSAWSLMAIAQWRQRLTEQACISIWLPDFFCNASLVPLRSLGAKLLFYPINEQMEPDMYACRNLVGEKRPDLFVLVHFFGQPKRSEDATLLCRETGAWLIEDAAHALRPTTGIGECGDCVLYSPHKHLPIPDGAVLVIRADGPSKLTTKPSALIILKEVCYSLHDAGRFSSYLPNGLWVIKRVMQRLGIRTWRQPMIPFLMDTPPTLFGQNLIHPKMSLLAKRLLSSLLGTVDTVAHLRLQNKLLWNQVLAKVSLAPPEIRPVPSENTPYLAGFSFPDEKLATKVFFQWQRAGLPVTTWPDLPPEVSTQKKSHNNALIFRQTRIYLPVHQSLDRRQIIDCIGRLKEKV